ncbi:MAG: ferritin [Saccharofermentanales bacterium]
MLNKSVVTLLNEQVNKEFYSAYLYLDFSFYFTNRNLNGFAHWYNVQAQEEKDHAMLFTQYLLNNSEKVKLTEIAMPDGEYENFAAPLAAGLAHEEFVTASINNIYAEALAVKEFRTTQFLDWFIKEQGEEEKNADELIQKFKLFGQDSKGLYLLDAELMTRVYAPPSLVL